MNLSSESFTIGADPEVFLKDTHGWLKSAIPYIRGTKDTPIMLRNGAGLQHDNVALEFASPVANNLIGFLRSINVSLGLIKKELPFGYSLAHDIAAADFPETELKDEAAFEFGCSPDYNAWERVINDKPVISNPQFRSCGGHIHVGFVEGSDYKFLSNPDDLDSKARLIKVMDCIHGLLSVFLDKNEGATERRKLYGGAGCFRPTSYGVEYRTLSNFWIKDNTLISLMYHLTKDALRLVRDGKDEHLIKLCGGKDVIVKMINTNTTDTVTRSRVLGFLSKESVLAFHKAEAVVSN